MIDLAEIQANTRAHRIADAVAEDAIRCNGIVVNTDCYLINAHENEFLFDCAHHLKYHGQAAVMPADKDGLMEVILGDFTMEGLA